MFRPFISIFTCVFRKSPPERYMNPDIWLIRYSEIFLKSEPVRRVWEDLLIHSLKQKLPDCTISKTRGRIWISGKVDPDAISHTFGVYSFSPCIMFPLSDLNERVLAYVNDTGFSEYKTFALRINRSGNHPFTSQELARSLGAHIQKSCNCCCWPHQSWIWITYCGPGWTCYSIRRSFPVPGIPQGASAPLSPCIPEELTRGCMFMMMKRGAILHPVYVKIAPFLDDRSEERDIDCRTPEEKAADLTLESLMRACERDQDGTKKTGLE